MNGQDILQQFESINTWQRKGVRAPHKPLLMLLALGEIQRGSMVKQFYPKPEFLRWLVKEVLRADTRGGVKHPLHK